MSFYPAATQRKVDCSHGDESLCIGMDRIRSQFFWSRLFKAEPRKVRVRQITSAKPLPYTRSIEHTGHQADEAPAGIYAKIPAAQFWIRTAISTLVLATIVLALVSGITGGPWSAFTSDSLNDLAVILTGYLVLVLTREVKETVFYLKVFGIVGSFVLWWALATGLWQFGSTLLVLGTIVGVLIGVIFSDRPVAIWQARLAPIPQPGATETRQRSFLPWMVVGFLLGRVSRKV